MKQSIIFVFLGLYLTGGLNETTQAQGLKGQSSRTHAIVLVKKNSQKIPDTIIRLGFVGATVIENAGAEELAAYRFLQQQRNIAPATLTFSEILKKPGILKRFDVIWFHTNNMDPLPEDAMNKKVIDAFRDYLESGGKLLLTLEAFKYILPLGLETKAPMDSLKVTVDDGYGRKLGFHAFLDHPAFAGMNGGAYIMMPRSDTAARITGYFGNSYPANGKVVAVDWDYIFLREKSKLVLEYEPGKGRVLAIGAYTWFSAPNLNRAHLDRFMANIFRYLAGTDLHCGKHYWDYTEPAIIREQVIVPLKVSEQQPAGKPWKIPEDPLTLSRSIASDDFWDVAGQRLLTMGTETGGITEVWAHPFLAFRDYEAGMKFENQDSVCWLNYMHPQIEVHPECFIRQYRFPQAVLKEVIVNDPAEPLGVIHYEFNGDMPAQIIFRFRSMFRLMWPYSENVTRSLHYSSDPSFGVYTIREQDRQNALVIGANKPAKQALIGPFSAFLYDKERKEFHGVPSDEFKVSACASYELKANDVIDLAYCATSEGLDSAWSGYGRAVRDPYRVYRDARNHVEKILNERLTFITPDKVFNTGYSWALLAADRFLVNTPGMGKSLVAGYSTTAHGWDGGHAVSGRPGYSWYFGRDGEWSGFALLETGDFTTLRSELEFYRKYQDLSGKILHEATTSGVIHYDAADATPLYIQLAGRYFRYANDTAFLRQSWPSIKKAIDFCFSTDTDNDHLIENTNVGHGWVEGGELYGSHATLYLQGCWSDALSEASGMAKALNVDESGYYTEEAKTVRQIINTSFWNEGKHFFAYGMNKNRTFRSEPTILPAVPACFKLLDKGKMNMVLSQYASNAFSTNWGTRIVRDDSPLFKPAGYHYGSVWPLFTGWTSLAEYAYGNYAQGYFHLMNNMDLYKNRALGFSEEVLNGAEYEPSGVCAHQCWSETMVLQPAIEGMLGLNVSMPEDKIELAPRLPVDWDSLTVQHIHAGNHILDFRMKRSPDNYDYNFSPSGNGNLDLDFLPSFPPGTLFTKLLLDGKQTPFTVIAGKQSATIITSINLNHDHNLVIFYKNGIEVVPLKADPEPGDPAAGLRIISTNFNLNTYEIELENKPGTHGVLTVYLHDKTPVNVENAAIIKKEGDYITLSVDFESGTENYHTKTVKITLNN